MTALLSSGVELFPVDVLEGLTVDNVQRVCQRNHDLSRTDRRVVDVIARLRGSGMSVRAVKDLVGVGNDTILAVDRWHPELVGTAKERAAATCFETGVVLAEKLREAALDGRLKPGEMGLASGIMFTKAGELRGEASAVIEVRHVESADDYLSRLRRVEGSIDVSSTGKVEECGGFKDGSAAVVAEVVGDSEVSPTPGLGSAAVVGQAEGAGGGVAEAGGRLDHDGNGRTN